MKLDPAVYVRAAEILCDGIPIPPLRDPPVFSCTALIGAVPKEQYGDYWRPYVAAFAPEVDPAARDRGVRSDWVTQNLPPHQVGERKEVRVLMLCFAAAMAATGDL